MIAAIRQRIADYLRERRIKDLSARIIDAKRFGGDLTLAYQLQALWLAEINARSGAQIARMERRLGIAPRTALKQTIVDAHCRGVLPAFVVRSAFRVFRLRRL